MHKTYPSLNALTNTLLSFASSSSSSSPARRSSGLPFPFPLNSQLLTKATTPRSRTSTSSHSFRPCGVRHICGGGGARRRAQGRASPGAVVSFCVPFTCAPRSPGTGIAPADCTLRCLVAIGGGAEASTGLGTSAPLDMLKWRFDA